MRPQPRGSYIQLVVREPAHEGRVSPWSRSGCGPKWILATCKKGFRERTPWRFYDHSLLVMLPPDTNRGPSVGGGWIRLGARRLAGGSCRDEVAAAIQALAARTGVQLFTVRDVYAKMLATGTRYRESTVFKTMQRMKAPPERPPFMRLDRQTEKVSGWR